MHADAGQLILLDVTIADRSLTAKTFKPLTVRKAFAICHVTYLCSANGKLSSNLIEEIWLEFIDANVAIATVIIQRLHSGKDVHSLCYPILEQDRVTISKQLAFVRLTVCWVIDRLLQETFEPELLTAQPSLAASDSCSLLVEVPAVLSSDCGLRALSLKTHPSNKRIVHVWCHQGHASHGQPCLSWPSCLTMTTTSHVVAHVRHVRGHVDTPRDCRPAV